MPELYTSRIAQLETSPRWSVEFGPTINPVTAEGKAVLLVEGGLRLYCVSPTAYAGWLAKHSSPLFPPTSFTRLLFSYTLTIDEATQRYGQVVETDTKWTDKDGWTYPGDFQFLVANKWTLETGNPWKPSAVSASGLFLPGVGTDVTIEHQVDIANRQTRVGTVMVGGKSLTVNSDWRKATQAGWGANSIVTQLQLCTGSAGGGYAVTFSKIGYDLTGQEG